MLVYPPGASQPLRGDLVVRTVLRTDLTPAPSTVELELRKSAETDRAIAEGEVVRVGPDRVEYQLVKVTTREQQGEVQGSREMSTIRAIGILAACVPIAMPLQRAVIREGSSLGEIYRACGSSLRIDSDFAVPQFSCFFGMTPSFEVAKVLQEEAGVLMYAQGKVQFRRLAELKAAPAVLSVRAEATEAVESGFLERHQVPFGFTTDVAGSLVVGRREAARGVAYRPRGDQRIVNNLSVALVLRRRMRVASGLQYSAGARVDVDGRPHVAITVAHVFESGGDGEGGAQYSQMWLGELSS